MTRPPLSLLLLALPAFCAADTVTILGGGAPANAPSTILGSGDFTGDTTVELSFVGSVGGQVDKAITTSLYELIAGVESIVSDSIGAEEAGRVSLPEGTKPRVQIITEIECPNDITYASKAGDTCLHLVMEVPLAVTNGPAEYEVKDVMKNKFHRATNLEGRLYGAIQTANANTAFVGVGKPGAGRG